MYVDVDGTLTGSGTIGHRSGLDGTLLAGTTSLTFLRNLEFFSNATTRFALGSAGGSFTMEGTLDLDGALEATVVSAGYYTLFSYGELESGSAFSSTGITGTGGFTLVDSVLSYGSGTESVVSLLAIGEGQTIQFWDGPNMTGDSTVNGGTGVWNDANTNWTGAPGSAGVNGPWIGSVGVFMGDAGT